MPPRPSPALPPAPPLSFYNNHPKAGAVCDALRTATPAAAIAQIATSDPMVFWSFFYAIFDDGELDLEWWPAFAAVIPWDVEIPRAAFGTSMLDSLLPPERTTGTIGWMLQFANIIPSRYRLQALITSPLVTDQHQAAELSFPREGASAQHVLARFGPEIFAGLPDDPAIHDVWRAVTAVPERPAETSPGRSQSDDSVRAAIGSLLLPAPGQAFAWLQPASVVHQLRHERAEYDTRPSHEQPGLTHSLALWALAWYPEVVSRHHRPVLRELLLHPEHGIRVHAMRALGRAGALDDPATADRAARTRRSI